MERGPIRWIKQTLASVQERFQKADEAVNGAARLAGRKLGDLHETLAKRKNTLAEKAQEFIEFITHREIPEGDNVQGSTPYAKKMLKPGDEGFDTTNVDKVLKKLGHSEFQASNAVKFFDEDTKYWKMTEHGTYLEDLKHFGVPDDLQNRHDERYPSSIAHKDFIRAHLRKTISNPLPEDKKRRDKVLAFQVFAFTNAALLVGRTKYTFPKALYKDFVQSAIKNKNVLPLVFMHELAGIDLKKVFESADEYRTEAIEKAQRQRPPVTELVSYLETQDLEQAFPKAFSS